MLLDGGQYSDRPMLRTSIIRLSSRDPLLLSSLFSATIIPTQTLLSADTCEPRTTGLFASLLTYIMYMVCLYGQFTRVSLRLEGLRSCQLFSSHGVLYWFNCELRLHLPTTLPLHSHSICYDSNFEYSLDVFRVYLKSCCMNIQSKYTLSQTRS